MKTKLQKILLASLLSFSVAQAETYDGINTEYNNKNVSGNAYHEELTLLNATDKIKWELLAVTGTAVFLGAKNWNWGSSNSFNMNSEGWFGMDTGSAGADKLGHMYSSYLINEIFTKNLMNRTNDKQQAAIYSTLFSSGIMLMVEVFDGYSVDHGFSYEDLIANGVGIGISYLKNTVPGLDEKIDLRIEYDPTDEYRNHPVTDYSGHTYWAALKLGGFEDLQDTPFKYFELQVGYHAEGFKKHEEFYYPEKKAEVLVGIGLDLTEVFFKPLKKHTNGAFVDYADTFFRYYQSPTYLSTDVSQRTEPYYYPAR